MPASSQSAVPGLVTTIIPVHNRPRLLVEAVASVLAQTYRPIEVVIVDDGSTDDTPAVIARLAGEHAGVRAAQRPNGGPGASRETGRQLARGEFIQYLDSDDLLLPDKFSLQVAALREHEDCGAAYGKTRFHGGGDDARPLKRTGDRIDAMFPAFLYARCWDTSTPLFRRSVTDLAGPWLPLWHEEDWEYDCRIAALGTRLVYCDAFVSEQRDHDGDRLRFFGTERRRLHHRAMAHARIFEHALSGGIAPGTAPMRHFSRELFLLCRQCGVAGLDAEAATMLALAERAAGASGRRADIRAYRMLAAVLGWRRLGGWSARLDGLRNRSGQAAC